MNGPNVLRSVSSAWAGFWKQFGRDPVEATLAITMLVILFSALVWGLFNNPALATEPGKPAQRIAIPEASALYRHRVEQVAADVWGVNASAAHLAAQLHQESAWKPRALSPGVGAQGLAQFMPDTARWIAQVFPAQLGKFDPWDPMQSIHAAALYDKWLLDRVQPIGWTRLTECSRWNFALRGYNGGETWLMRERGLTVAGRGDANDWRSVERFRSRGQAAHNENINYPRRILLTLEPAYIAAGWPGTPVCN